MKNKNHYFLDEEGVICIYYIGDQTAESIKKLNIQVNKLIQKLKSEKQKVLVLADITEMGDVSLGGRKTGIELLRKIEYDKLAVYGKRFVDKYLVDIIVMASGMSFKIKFFLDLKEARAFLT